MSTKKSPDSTDSAGQTQAVPRNIPLFPLGTVVATPGVIEHFKLHQINAQEFIDRHQCGDWSTLQLEDSRENEFSLQQNFRILSYYEIAGERVWIITEADRSSTTLLFPSEY